jgi:predicted PurR-regulated permease PerM
MNQTVKFPLFDTVLRVIVLFLLIAWCIGIILPFVEPVLGGAVIAIALYPFFAVAKRWVGNRNMLAGVLLTLLILVILLLPTALLIRSLVEGVQSLAIQFRNQTLVIPPPDPSVAGWLLIGKPVSEIWLLASQSLVSVITTYREPLSKLGMAIIGPLGGFGRSLILFFVSVVIAGVFLIKAEASADFARKLIHRLAGESRHHPLFLVQKRQGAKDRRHLMLQRPTPLSLDTATQWLSSPRRSLTVLRKP